MYYQKNYNKFGNHSKIYNGRSYDSKLEAAHAQELDLLLRAGEIKEVIPQYRVDLCSYGKHICNYYVDFKVINKDGSIEYHEVKGMETPDFIIKKKLFEAQLNATEPDSKYLILKQNSISYLKTSML